MVAMPNVPPLPVAVVVAMMPYPSVAAERAPRVAGMVYAGLEVARPAFASLMLSVHPRPVLQDSVDDAFGVEVATAVEVSVPNAVEEASVLHVTLDATVALTVTVLPSTKFNAENHPTSTTRSTLATA